jgi:hypothetical protein
MIAVLLLLFILPTIDQFSENLHDQLFLPFLIVAIFLLIFGSVVAFKDKEFIRIIPDERTKKVDRSAGYYSWWSTFFFVFGFGLFAFIKGFTVAQVIYSLFSEMFLTLILFHMYFYYKGEE